MNDDKEAFEQYNKQSMTVVGKVIYYTRSARYYRDGTYFSMRLKWWHPVSWFLLIWLLVVLVPACLLTGMSVKDWWEEVRDCFIVKKWFKDHPDELRWYNPYKEDV